MTEQSTQGTGATPSVIKYVTVPASIEHAFRLFTEQPLEWHPEHHILLKAPRESITIEPRVGGRWYEKAVDGTEADWGSVRAWDPPNEVVLSWRINGRWEPIDDESRASEIAVVFTAGGPGSTRVSIEHRKLDAHGEWAGAIHKALDGPSPGDTLEKYARAIGASLATS